MLRRHPKVISSGPLTPYRADPGATAYAWGDRRPAADAGADGWLPVAEAYETPGLIDAPGEVTLHTGAFGAWLGRYRSRPRRVVECG